ncbi:hypothetical protein [Brackiella oedipodis]|uniref:hypothetical protein n=1 Tax=Brackiella oedipodis TaxID=124225 RepID=UPI00048F4F86|nr:hypothetical protein [Brackiella oedipodis]
MPTNKRWLCGLSLACIFVSLSAGSIAWSQESAQTQDYQQADYEDAITLCMTVEYVKHYQLDPAENDVLPLCKARWNKLKAALPYAQYQTYILNTPYAYEVNEETHKVLQTYNNILMGVPNYDDSKHEIEN